MNFKATYIALLLVLSSVFVNTDAQDYTTAMKVQYIKSFTKYVEWPDEYKTGDFIIGVVDGSSYVEALQSKLEGKMIGNQTYKVVNYANVNSVGRCHVLYIPADKSASLKAAVELIKKYSTLVVTDKPGLITEGPSINLVMEGPKQKFEINKKTMTKYSLKVSAQLEPMASKVIN